jgi:hypothetical protein
VSRQYKRIGETITATRRVDIPHLGWCGNFRRCFDGGWITSGETAEMTHRNMDKSPTGAEKLTGRRGLAEYPPPPRNYRAFLVILISPHLKYMGKVIVSSYPLFQMTASS